MYEEGKLGILHGPSDAAQRLFAQAAALHDSEGQRRTSEYSQMASVPKQAEAALKSIHDAAVTVITRPTLPATTHPAPVPENQRRVLVRPHDRTIISDDRIEVAGQISAAVLGQEYRLSVKLSGPEPFESIVFISQTAAPLFGRPFREAVYQGAQISTLRAMDGGTSELPFVPYALGRLQVRLLALYPDHVILSKDLTIEVLPPPDGPTLIGFTAPGSHEMLRTLTPEAPLPLLLFTDSQPWPMSLSAVFDGVLRPLELDPHWVRFRLRSGPGATAVRLDDEANHLIALQPGYAVLEASYGGLTKLACVIVKAAGSGRSLHGTDPDCHDLYSPNELGRDER